MQVEEFRARRQALMQKMGQGVALIPTAPEVVRNRDSHFPYRADSYFYYLTGFDEPEAVVVLLAGESPKSILFCRDKDLEREIWDGFRHGPEGAREVFGFDEAYSITELDQRIGEYLANQPQLFFSLGAESAWDQRLGEWLKQLTSQARSGIAAPGMIVDVRRLLDAMRLIKTPYELDVMRKAADITVAAHKRAMRMTRPGMMEYEIEAEILHEFYRCGSRAPAYTSIVAGGGNACVLHYVSNQDRLKDGDLLLIDAGCELEGYAADITRTFPVNGKFSAVQKDIYELVLAMQDAAIEQVKPGQHWNAPHEAALKVLARGLIDLGLCHGSVDAVLESGDYRRFYMHRTGHWLGLDVHDAGEYKQANGEWCLLQPGMVLTVEPGCYIRPSDNVPEHFWNIGIRIEDDAVVTATGCEIMTAATPKTVQEVETWMATGHE
ncbi:aminopeptidase P Metallo peptidase. MEROPS family M24B [Methylobacillus rhizosphaerae]|uniref:Xaa-Pro aminopeptidase n=1 Tax=Methylobacillus rhizosphaerae TaxID=551994 RepID=A0A238Y395_9PROT|nr:Xaa-Pro aminopeptidase [Methylobacillus rhizosphaerae]SNR65490.1 aminopeptidase P Metallo peptidase. MEROPS family M24B [Methylobacillus rhizosphaerae]